MVQHPSSSAARRFRAALATACLLGGRLALADVDIEIRGVEDTLRANMLAHLSLARYRERDDLDRDTLDRLHNRVEREAKAALRPFGLYEPAIKSELREAGRGDWRVTIEVEPGPPVLLENVEVKVLGPGAEDRQFRRIVRRARLQPGERLNHAQYDQVKSDLQRTAATYGYLDAHLSRSELLVDPTRHVANVALVLETGPRYRFGTTSIEQTTIDEPLARRYLRYEEGDPFDVTQLLRTQFALDDSLYFSTVEVLPQDPNRETLTVPVSIRAQSNRRNRYSFGVGFGSDTGARGTALWEDRRLNTRGHRFSTELEAAQEAQSLQSRYIVPIRDPALEKFTFETTAEQRELADLDTESFELEPSITRVSGQWQRVWFTTATRTETESAIERRVDTLLIPGVSVARIPQGYLGEALFSRSFFAELRGSHGVFGSDSDFLQLRVQVERVFDITRRWNLLLRSEVGGSLVAEFSELPGSVRFFAGGDRSVRGFGYNDLSPVQIVPLLDAMGQPVLDDNDQPVVQRLKVGGKHLVTGTVEVVRDLPRRFGVAGFVDFGNAFDSFGDPPDPEDSDFLEFSAGVGVRWRLPAVTVGIDIAQPLTEPDAGPRFHINFSPRL